MPLVKDDIDRWYDYGVSPSTRTVYLGTMNSGDPGNDETQLEESGIFWNTARRVMQAIHMLDANAQSGDKPITVIMNSNGGDWSHGMAIYETIRYAKNHVTIINMSGARSMTSLIFQAADYRITTPSGYYMIHDGDMTVSGIPKSVSNWTDYEKQIVLPTMYDIYLKRLREKDDNDNYKVDINDAVDILNSKLPRGAERLKKSRGITGIRPHHIEQLCSQDTIFTPVEMIKLNFADRLIETNDLTGAYANPHMHGLPTGLKSLED